MRIFKSTCPQVLMLSAVLGLTPAAQACSISPEGWEHRFDVREVLEPRRNFFLPNQYSSDAIAFFAAENNGQWTARYEPRMVETLAAPSVFILDSAGLPKKPYRLIDFFTLDYAYTYQEEISESTCGTQHDFKKK